jgi:hypothetical protein
MASKKQKSPGYTQADYSIDAPDYVIAELRYDSGIAVTSANGFRAAEASMPDATRLNDVLAGFKVQRVAPHFELPQRVLAERADAIRSARAKVSSDYAKGGFVQIVPEKSADAAAIAKRLDKSDSVWTAYVMDGLRGASSRACLHQYRHEHGEPQLRSRGCSRSELRWHRWRHRS